jgi:hypothetical protein
MAGYVISFLSRGQHASKSKNFAKPVCKNKCEGARTGKFFLVISLVILREISKDFHSRAASPEKPYVENIATTNIVVYSLLTIIFPS